MVQSDLTETELEALLQTLGARKITNVTEMSDGTVVLRYSSEVAQSEPKPSTGRSDRDMAALHDRMDQLTAKIDALTEDRLEHERMSDRIAAVEYTLLGTLDRDEMPISDDQSSLIARKQRLKGVVPEPAAPPTMLEALQSAEDRIMASLQEAVAQMEFPAVVEPDIGSGQASERPAALGSDMATILERLDQKLDMVTRQPAPLLDLTQQRQSFARFLTSIGTVVARLERGVDQLDAQTAGLAASERFAAIEGQVASWTAQMENMVVSHAGRSAEMLDGFKVLGAKVDDLSNRPLPVPDLTAQRESFARFATSVSHTIARLEGVTDKLGAALELSLSDREGARSARIETQEPPPVLPNPYDPLTTAILKLTDQIDRYGSSVTQRNGNAFTGDHYRPEQDEFFQDMRYVFAELIATQMKARQAIPTAA